MTLTIDHGSVSTIATIGSVLVQYLFYVLDLNILPHVNES